MRLLIVQYAGDYREAIQRLDRGEGETYYAQKYSVNSVSEIAAKIESATVLCCMAPEPHNEVLDNGVRSISAGFDQTIRVGALIQLIEQQQPTHLVISTPIRAVFRWAIKNRIPTLATFADSFSQTGLRNKIRNYLLTQVLNHHQITWVANHGINSCRSLRAIGVKPDKIIPWDWPPVVTPESFLAKTLPAKTPSVHLAGNLVYVGALFESKGFGDILEAIALLKSHGWRVNLSAAGQGDLERFVEQSKQLQIADQVEFLGLVPNQSVVGLMRKADLVLVPSHHDYPEGMPMTIYEALSSRTPIVASDHPMFVNNLKTDVNAIIFPAGDVAALSASIQKLLSDSDLYSKISESSSAAWHQLQIPVKWADLINRWLFDSPENCQWLFNHRLVSDHYSSRLIE